ncbi:MAG: DUF2807 domain-containing protein [Alphaproteobacteria bacterium]|nr:DUF2807 domain-containing protein [Alphaproteobacteria bacterium]MBU1525041.1 DUF2807 domain-containing protein [Alphaproteobacteria bacterium]MBU2118378.1 DUF2807 domain-containing protein [Alphaproteobacteria bacterium]MBU2292545.1 DUF2807 domain-containing protein [Alphaproteobacteria bacterium]MBU2381427.1 DUF2807 domain-containing protein [Alphaproteobacteria bacterium]
MQTRNLAVSAAVLAVAAFGALAAPAVAQEVEIKDAVARVVVIVEDRTDVAVSVEAGRADLPALRVRRDGDATIVEGGLSDRRFMVRNSRIRDCRSGPAGASQPGQGASVDVRGVGRVNLADAPLIIIRAPRAVKVAAGSGVYGTVGQGAREVDLSIGGCGDWTVPNVTGDVRINIGGSGSALIGNTRELEINIGGSGEVRAGTTGGFDVNIGGSGDVVLAGATGGRGAVNIGGSGDVAVRAGRLADLEVNIAGSGDVAFDGTVGDLDVSIMGGGDVRVAEVTGRTERNIMGSGEVTVGR